MDIRKGEAWGREEVVKRALHVPGGRTRAEKAAAVSALAAEASVCADTVRRWAREARQEGKDTRKTRSDKGTNRLLADPEHRAELLRIVATRGVASDRIILRTFCEKFPEADFSEATGRRAIAQVTQELRGLKAHIPGPSVDYAHPLDRVEVDFSVADFFVSDPAVNGGRPFRPYFGAVIDASTRCVLWAAYTERAGREVFGGLLYAAIMPKDDPAVWPMHGTPVSCGLDHGKDFASKFGVEMLAALGIERALARPHVPQDKGRVERWFGTAHRMLEDRLPGWCGGDNKGEHSVDPTKTFRDDGRCWRDPRPHLGVAGGRKLLTLAEANEFLQQWITQQYHLQVQEGLGCAPLTAWQAGIMDVQERLDYVPAVLDKVCLTLAKGRKVRGGGVKVHGMFYTSPELSQYEGLSVQVRYNSADCREVAVYTDYSPRPIAAHLLGAKFVDEADPSLRRREELVKAEKARKAQVKAITKIARPDEAADLIPPLTKIARGETPVVALTGNALPPPQPERPEMPTFTFAGDSTQVFADDEEEEPRPRIRFIPDGMTFDEHLMDGRTDEEFLEHALVWYPSGNGLGFYLRDLCDVPERLKAEVVRRRADADLARLDALAERSSAGPAGDGGSPDSGATVPPLRLLTTRPEEDTGEFPFGLPDPEDQSDAPHLAAAAGGAR